ncbi:MAG: AraC family transcriptional regulator [Gammaproteobacteria bacterium]|nr:AraC family transcriptional regulator [Gammaproteobacteria bacterium]
MSQKQTTRYAQRINNVIDHIRRHLDDDLDVARLSELAHFSPFHFHRQFSSYTGISVYRLVQLLRLQRASMQLVFDRARSITDIGFAAGFMNAESFTRAFRKAHGQTPGAFRKNPQWQPWQTGAIVKRPKEHIAMVDPQPVEIVDFPETLIAALEHHGPEQLTYNTTLKFIEWRQANGLRPGIGNTYGIHYNDPDTTAPDDYRLDIALSVSAPVPSNPQGVVNKVIPGGRCARVRHLGSRHDVTPARWLYSDWLPSSGEELRDFPIFFHYVNVGPHIKPEEMITDVYLPLR